VTDGATVVLPLDGSQLAEMAIPMAARIAGGEGEPVGGTVILLGVPEVYGLEPSWHSGATIDAGAPMVPADQLMADARAKTELYLTSVAGHLAELGVRSEIVVADVDPERAIVDAAAERGATMVVMASHGWGGVAAVALGSTTDKVLRSSTVPVLVVRSGAEHVDPRLDHLMVALDGSPGSEVVLEPMRDLALDLGSALTLVHVVVEPTIAPETAALLEAESKHVADMRRYLGAIVTDLRLDGIDARRELLAGADPAEVLLERQARGDVDLLGLTSRAPEGWPKLSVPSVTDRVLHGAHAPVLVQRAPGRR